MFEDRRKQLGHALSEQNCGTVIISNPSNLYYFTGFTGGEAIFVMSLYTKEGYVITDSRYYEQVEKECPDLTLIRLEKRSFSEIIKELLFRLATETENQITAIEESMNLSQYLKLCEICEGFEFRICSEQINACRMVKDDEELEKIAKAEAIGDAAFSYILTIIKPGIKENEIALELEYFMKKQGASKLSFDTIVASGSNSSMPHAQVTGRKVQDGDFVTMDFGCVYKGYCSDMTRTIAIGAVSEDMKKVYQIVLDANQRALNQIKEGEICNYIDSLARDYIKEQGYGEYFGHGLGHGVGLDIHEEPRFSPKCDVVTKENMVITVEPGIYLPGKFGVRIEDLVIVQKEGYKKLSNSEKELIIL